MQVFVCRSGSAADTQNISAYVAHYLRQHEMDVGEPDVATAANIAMQIVYNNKVRIKTPEQWSALPPPYATAIVDGGGCCNPAPL
jgi:20S proteasome alpha/beta subunit